MAQQPTSPAVSREPVRGFDLDRYAVVAAQLAEQTAPRATILASASVDEMTWIEVEKTWLLRVAAAAMKGDLSLAQEYEQRYVAAQDALGPTDPTHGLDELAAIMRELSLGGDARDVLPRHRLTLAGFSRLQRAWARRLAADENLAKAYQAMLGARAPDAPR